LLCIRSVPELLDLMCEAGAAIGGDALQYRDPLLQLLHFLNQSLFVGIMRGLLFPPAPKAVRLAAADDADDGNDQHNEGNQLELIHGFSPSSERSSALVLRHAQPFDLICKVEPLVGH